jgi:hypothetical protein
MVELEPKSHSDGVDPSSAVFGGGPKTPCFTSSVLYDGRREHWAALEPFYFFYFGLVD